jgi:RecA-family ATPase
MIRVYWDMRGEWAFLRLDYADPVKTWDEYHAAIQQAWEMARNHDGDVVLIHHPGKTSMPQGNAIGHMQRGLQDHPENIVAVFVIVNNAFARRMMELLLRTSTNNPHLYKYRFLASVEDAYERILAPHERN